ncbi:hypothetical protein Tco_0073029 [Tanacetum coccineum]
MLAWWCSPKDLMIPIDVTVLPLIRYVQDDTSECGSDGEENPSDGINSRVCMGFEKIVNAARYMLVLMSLEVSTVRRVSAARERHMVYKLHVDFVLTVVLLRRSTQGLLKDFMFTVVKLLEVCSRLTAHLNEFLLEISLLNVREDKDKCICSLDKDGVFAVGPLCRLINDRIFPSLDSSKTWDKTLPHMAFEIRQAPTSSKSFP